MSRIDVPALAVRVGPGAMRSFGALDRDLRARIERALTEAPDEFVTVAEGEEPTIDTDALEGLIARAISESLTEGVR